MDNAFALLKLGFQRYVLMVYCWVTNGPRTSTIINVIPLVPHDAAAIQRFFFGRRINVQGSATIQGGSLLSRLFTQDTIYLSISLLPNSIGHMNKSYTVGVRTM